MPDLSDLSASLQITAFDGVHLGLVMCNSWFLSDTDAFRHHPKYLPIFEVLQVDMLTCIPWAKELDSRLQCRC